MSDKITRADGQFDPERCQSIIKAGYKAGQCDNKAFPGSKFCAVHGGNSHPQSVEKENIKIYNLTKWKAQLDSKLKDPDAVINLREEIGILRILIEERLNFCNDTTDILMHSSIIADLISRVERVIASCHKIEEKRGNLLDKDQLLQICTSIVAIIGKYITDDKVMSNIANDVGQMILKSVVTSE